MYFCGLKTPVNIFCMSIRFTWLTKWRSSNEDRGDSQSGPSPIFFSKQHTESYYADVITGNVITVFWVSGIFQRAKSLKEKKPPPGDYYLPYFSSKFNISNFPFPRSALENNGIGSIIAPFSRFHPLKPKYGRVLFD